MQIPRLGGPREVRPPGPRGSFGVGNLAAYESDRLGFLLGLRDDYGGVVRLGARTTVINDPALALEVLRNRSGTFGVRENFLQQRLGPVEMADRLAPRPLLNAALRPSGIRGIVPLLEARLLDDLPSGACSQGGWFDPFPVLERSISRSIAEFCFGPGSEAIAARIGELLDELGQIIGNPFALPEWVPSPVRRRIEERYHAVVDLVLPALERRATAPDDYSDLAGAIMANNGTAHPLARIADLLTGALLAAHRVPAAAGAWMLMLAADHPTVQASVRSEATSANDAPQGEDDAARRIALESLRLYPATWMVARIVEKDVDVGRWRFRRGHNFLISPYVVHRDDRLFPDSSRFLPDRWRQGTLPEQAAFLAFGSGIHLCPGRSLAVSILSTTLATIASRYKIDRRQGPVVANPRTTLMPVGLQVRLTPREPVTEPGVVSTPRTASSHARFGAAASA